MSLLSMAIGALPVGTFVLGEVMNRGPLAVVLGIVGFGRINTLGLNA